MSYWLSSHAGIGLSIPTIFWLILCPAAAEAQIRGGATAATRTVAQPAAGSALRGLFNPATASSANTMGLLQRSNFIDRVAGATGRIEIALVVDATESMEAELEGIRQQLQGMLDDIRRVAGPEVYVQIVLYRDQGAASGAVSWPMEGHEFTRDVTLIQNALDQLVPQTGAPYFLEAVDQGLFAALSELAWSSAPQTTRWLFLIGDAPPFDRGFSEPETGAARMYATEQLVQMAQQRGIEINAILCPTRPQDESVYQEVVGSTRFFFGELTSQTGGWMLDLSDPQLRSRVAEGAEEAVSDFIAIEPIRRGELEEMRAAAMQSQAAIAPDQRARVAVLPHLPLAEMTFSRREPAVRFADEMRSQLETVGLDVEVVSSYEIERTFRKLNLQGMNRDAALQQIGLGTAADYVFWGALINGQPDKVQSGILETKSGNFVVTIPSLDTRFPARASVCSAVLDALAQASKQAGNPLQLARVQRRFRTRLVAESQEVERLIIAARGTLADALQMQLGQGNSDQLYTEAQSDLEAALKLAPDDPIINSLLANVYFSQFQIMAAQDDPSAIAKRRLANQFAGAAKKNLNRLLESDQLEIDADFNFYRNNFEQAAQLYEQIVERGDTLAQVERARWMLAGIYSGDWGIDSIMPQLVDPAKARAQVVQLMAFFPDSPHTRLLEKYLLWDDDRGGTINANLPRTHVGLADQ